LRYSIEYFCYSDRGKVRTVNQDNYICEKQYMQGTEVSYPLHGTLRSKQPSLIGVFDGMGGEEQGEVASMIAAECAAETVVDNPVRTSLELCTTANNRICEYAEENNVRAMGTTAAFLVFADRAVVLCNIGDSRIYRFRNHDLEQLSVDHYSAAPYGSKPPLSQNLGIPSSEMIIEPYVRKQNYADQDIYLICTDGLTDMLKDEEILQILESSGFESAGEKMITQALEKGGIDNITVILCRIRKEEWGLLEFLHLR